MSNDSWMRLKSGSDIRGIAIEETDGEKITLTNDVVEKICRGFATWLSKKNRLLYSSINIAIGHDSRVSAVRIKNASINSLKNIGINVYDCSLSSTPAMFMAISTLSCTGSIQITASHHPSCKNGFKFFTSDGGVSESDIEEILNLAQKEIIPSNTIPGKVRTINLMNYYSEKLRKTIKDELKSKEEQPLKGLKIIVDAGNGVGGFFVNDVLKPLGADTTGSVFLEPDGNFPNHVPNPEDADAMRSISDVTLKSKADLGIIFDTDVDRVAFVGCDGQEISKNKLIALASLVALKNNFGGIIVTDSVTSDYLKLFIEKEGGMHFRYKRGYHNVISLAKKINEKGENCPLAIESSGHAAFKENSFMDDGAFLAVKIIIELLKRKKRGENLQDSFKDLIDAKERIDVRIPVNLEEDIDECQKLFKDLENHSNSKAFLELDKENIEGVRITFKAKHQKGWLLIRKSLHDPTMVLYVESYVFNGVKSILNFIYPFLKKYRFINLNELNKILSKNI